MNTFDYIVKALWDVGFFTIVLPFLLVFTVSFYFFKWLFEDKWKKDRNIFKVIRWALTIAISLAVLWLSLSTTAFGEVFGGFIGFFFLVIFVVFILALMGHYLDIDVLARFK